jgi:hypothetical protein
MLPPQACDVLVSYATESNAAIAQQLQCALSSISSDVKACVCQALRPGDDGWESNKAAASSARIGTTLRSSDHANTCPRTPTRHVAPFPDTSAHAMH